MGHESQDAAKTVGEFMGLVRSEARRVRTLYGLNVEMDDLVSWGTEGLLDAHRRFDASRGLAFSAFAHYRVRGAILDGVRSMGFVSRRLHAKLRAAEAADRLGEELSETRAAAAPEVRESLAANAAMLAQSLSRITASVALSIVGQGDGDEPTSPESIVIEDERQRRLAAVIDALPERERLLVRGFYFDGRRFEDVATELGISKSWASRLHTKALDRIRAALDE